MKYNGYKLTRDRSTGNYTVRTPDGTGFAEVAVNVKTAKLWVDQDIAEKRAAIYARPLRYRGYWIRAHGSGFIIEKEGFCICYPRTLEDARKSIDELI